MYGRRPDSVLLTAMNKKTKQITAAALMTAVAVALICLAQVVPTMKLSLTAVAGIAAALLVAEYGPVSGLLCYAASSVLSMLLAPASGWMYVVFFGWYPVVKCLIERINRQRIEWPLKLAAFNAAFFVLWFFLPAVLADLIPKLAGVFWPLFLCANAAFVLFDIGLSQLLNYYIRVILPKIRKK